MILHALLLVICMLAHVLTVPVNINTYQDDVFCGGYKNINFVKIIANFFFIKIAAITNRN